MIRAAVRRRPSWLRAEVVDQRPETSCVRRLVLDVPGWRGHLPGQHVDVRLRGEDGDPTHRSYCLASPPGLRLLHLLVERIDGGEVSSYLASGLRVGDALEVRGPIGDYFVWSVAADRAERIQGRRPLQLVAGGTGVAPFAAMLDHHRRLDSPTPLHLLYSAPTEDDVLVRDVLGPETTITLARDAPRGWRGETGRVDAAMLERCTVAARHRPRVFVCGPTAFAESVATQLVGLGHDPTSIRIERFGNGREP